MSAAVLLEPFAWAGVEGTTATLAVSCAALLLVVAAVRLLRSTGGRPRVRPRVPAHVALVLQDGNEAETAAVQRLLGWLGRSGVQHATVYHSRPGVLRADALAAAAAGTEGGYRRPALRVASEVDGRPAFFALVRRAAAEGRVVDEEYVSAHLPICAGRPDPELMVVFGRCRSVYGFPAWPIAVTEMVFRSDVRGYTPAQYDEDLQYFSRTKPTVKSGL
eukprot:Rhum_TRINITY_DN12709_c0_g1::Rhum_TRINITY_DN12709_c0_g1_i1::g.53817::m.53817